MNLAPRRSESFHCAVPAERLSQAKATAAILGEEVYKRFPWAHYDCGGASAFALPSPARIAVRTA